MLFRSFSQFSEDAIRLSSPGFGVSARSLGMGNAFTSVADDFSSVFWNPAGLGQIGYSEISFNLSHFVFQDKGSYLNNNSSFSNSSTSLNQVGFIFPLPTLRGSCVIGLGYSQTKDFTTGLKFSGFNPTSSIIQDWATDGKNFPVKSDGFQSLAYQLYLANIDSNSTDYFYDSPIINNLLQSGAIVEDGGINRWALSAAVEAAPQLFLGATLNILRGNYQFNREYKEEDAHHLYETAPFDFEYLKTRELLDEDIGGFDAQLGLLYNFGTQGSFGFKLQTPTVISIEEKFQIGRAHV